MKIEIFHMDYKLEYETNCIPRIGEKITTKGTIMRSHIVTAVDYRFDENLVKIYVE